MAAETDKFVIATFALWAGDFEYVEELLRGFSPQRRMLSISQSPRRPEDLIRVTGALRLRQLRQKRAEFKRLTQEYADQGGEITDTPNVLETTHLRATVWRIGEREFLMQGYLKELEWQNRLFDQARQQAGKSDLSDMNISIPPSDSIGFLVRRDSWRPLGAAWVVPGNPFLQVELSDLGLLEASGFWTELQLPDNAEQITGAFHNLLRALDEPET